MASPLSLKPEREPLSLGTPFHSSAVRQMRLAIREPLSASSTLQIIFGFAGFAGGVATEACCGEAGAGSETTCAETSNATIRTDIKLPPRKQRAKSNQLNRTTWSAGVAALLVDLSFAIGTVRHART